MTHLSNLDEPKTLWEHVSDGLDAVAAAALRAPGADPDVVQAWRDMPHTFIVVAAVEQRRRRRRAQGLDTRSTWFRVVALTEGSNVAYEVVDRIQARDLIDADGQPVDPRATAHDLLAQLQTAPDHVPAEWTSEPPA